MMSYTSSSVVYQQVRQALLSNPRDSVAWLRLSSLVDDVTKQRECLERALALDPGCQAARDGLENLRIREVLASACSVVAAREHSQQRRKIGEYLVAEGWLSQGRLDSALAEQCRRQTSLKRVALGEILIERGWLTPQQLAKALIWQQEEFSQQQYVVPERLGDYLMMYGYITPAQLEGVLAIQAELQQLGQSIRVGELLIRFGYVTLGVLNQILERQHADSFANLNH